MIIQMFGGPHDGRWVKVETPPLEYLFPTPPPLTSAFLREETPEIQPRLRVSVYRRARLNGGNEYHFEGYR